MSIPCHWEIPGIKNIYTVDPSTLPSDIPARGEAGLPITIVANAADELVLADIPECVVTETHRANGTAYETTLKFITTSRFIPNEPRAWVVVDASDKKIILGARELPFPVLTSEATTGLPSKRKGVECEVKCCTYPSEVLLILR